MRMRSFVFGAAALFAATVMLLAYFAFPAEAGIPPSNYKVLEPIQQGNLAIFPVIAAGTHDTSQFLTLDEGLRSGEVVVTEETGNAQPLMRRRSRPLPPGPPAQVNQLVLINNSNRPLLLLAGEIVTGGKQDRVIGSDRIVPPASDPIDLSVFCVEPGRWAGASGNFGATAGLMAQPSVRNEAMAARDQQKVWARVAEANAAAAPRSTGGSTSYAQRMETVEAKSNVDKVAEPLNRSYAGMLRQLKEHNAVGVVVALNGRFEWVDLFASQALLQKYWPKLVRSYAAESLGSSAATGKIPGTEAAQQFLAQMAGEREVTHTEADLYRETEIQGTGWKAFRLTSLLPKTGYDLHIAKMLTAGTPEPLGLMRRNVE